MFHPSLYPHFMHGLSFAENPTELLAEDLRQEVQESYREGCLAFEKKQYERAKDLLKEALKNIDTLIKRLGKTVTDRFLIDIRYKYVKCHMESSQPEGGEVVRQCNQILGILKGDKEGEIHFLKAQGLLITDECDQAIDSAEKAKKFAHSSEELEKIDLLIRSAKKKLAEVDAQWIKGTNAVGDANLRSRNASESKKKKKKKRSRPKKKAVDVCEQQRPAARESQEDDGLDTDDLVRDDGTEEEEEEEEAVESTADEEDKILLPLPDPTIQPVSTAPARSSVDLPERSETKSSGWMTNAKSYASSPRNKKFASPKLAKWDNGEQIVELPPFPRSIGKEYDCDLVCWKCWKGFGTKGGTWTPHDPDEQCKLNVLIFGRRGEANASWHFLRPRPSIMFSGRYQMCKHFTTSGVCYKNYLECTFAHHEVEQQLWTLEKDRQFHIYSFVELCRKVYNDPGSLRSSDFSQPLGSSHMEKFDLESVYEFKICCNDCPDFSKDSDCAQNVLVVRSRSSLERFPDGSHIREWVRVRERVNFRSFPGNYRRCRTTYPCDPPAKCQPSEEECCFAHNWEEQNLWNKDKDGSFSISEFIKAHSNSKDPPLRRFLRKYPGLFLYLCRQCYYGSGIISQECQDDDTCEVGHDWTTSRTLARWENGLFTLIHIRPNSLLSWNVKPCRNDRFCVHRTDGTCRYVHNQLEKDFGHLEEEGITQDQVVAESWRLDNNDTGLTLGIAGADPPADSPRTDVKPPEPRIVKVDCPYKLVFACEKCWKIGGRVSIYDEGEEKCPHDRSLSSSTVCVYLATKERIRQPKFEVPEFTVCRSVKCPYPETCKFGNSQVEVNVWTWMRNKNVKTLEEAVRMSKKSQQKKEDHSPAPYHYCGVCSIGYGSQQEWEDHCSSAQHTENVNSDKDQQWNLRRPPVAADSSELKLCPSHINEEKCQYSKVHDVFNYCNDAHCQEELDEWQARLKHLQMKREMTAQYSYMDQILNEDYKTSDSRSVMTEDEEMLLVCLDCSSDLTLYLEDKTASQDWMFEISPPKGGSLVKVALLHNKNRVNFSLVAGNLRPNTQVTDGSIFSQEGNYIVHVRFQASMFGSFSQTVVFDFGSRPVLTRTLRVEVGSEEQHKQVKQLRSDIAFDRWTSDANDIVRFSGEMDQTDRELLLAFKSPKSEEDVVNQELLSQELNVNNYFHLMKGLLSLEELKRNRILSRYNLETRITCLGQISEKGVGLVNSKEGELFAKVPLDESITEDTDAGQLILSSVTHVLLAPRKTKSERVYEALIVNEERFDFKFRSCDYIYICLSATTVKELDIKEGDKLKIELQFQMDRLPFCRMYRALENLGEDRSLLFPIAEKVRDVWTEASTDVNTRSESLNDSQLTVVRYVTAPHSGYTPPLVVYGPFGTGKTLTFIECAVYLALKHPKARVLICAHSNSAADLYVKGLKEFKDLKPKTFCRIYGTHRRVNTVDKEVREYCFLTEHRNRFREPTLEDIENHKVVIMTLSCSLMIAKLRGNFTHIFIDEAAQALEAEVIMPLALAAPGTCVVLAGDYEQLSPPVYTSLDTSLDKCRHLRKSILHRLIEYYEMQEKNSLSGGDKLTESPFTVLLLANYRSRKEIAEFLSFVFYRGKMTSNSPRPAPKDIPAMAFYCTQGEEKIPENGTSYINMAEVKEVALRVEDLMKRWPNEWGEPDQKKVAVVTPYNDQVEQIRYALRRKGYPGVHVVRVNNIQGKEFDAVFISTVRTMKQDEDLQLSETEGTHLGFLSNKRLLNSALTRARDHVAVVGDPVALLGRSTYACMHAWRIYLEHCGGSRSLFPKDNGSLTVEEIHDELQASIHRSQAARNKRKCRLLEEFRLEQRLGKGGFGTVFQAYNKLEDNSCAIKMIPLSHKDARSDQVMREVRALAKLNHQGIVRYFTSWTDRLPASLVKSIMKTPRNKAASTWYRCESYTSEADSSGIESQPSSQTVNRRPDLTQGTPDSTVVFASGSIDKVANPSRTQEDTAESDWGQRERHTQIGPRDYLFIQMELCKPETLKDWLNKHSRERNRVEVIDMFVQIVSAIEYIHSKKLIHRDLAPKNIFISLEDVVKVGDFGLARTSPAALSEDGGASGHSGNKLSQEVGTFTYMSPEQIARVDYNEKVDIYALGLILFEMLTPFSTESERYATLKDAREGRYPETFPETHASEHDLVQRSLRPNPEERPTAADLSRRLKDLTVPLPILQIDDIRTCKEFYLGQQLEGESQVIEYKKGLQGETSEKIHQPDKVWDIPRTVCAFLNQDQGGIMLLGVEEVREQGDQNVGKVVGVCQPSEVDPEGQPNWLCRRVNSIIERKIVGECDTGIQPEILPVYNRRVSTQNEPARKDGKDLFVIRICVKPPTSCEVPDWSIKRKGQIVYCRRRGLEISCLTEGEVLKIAKAVIAKERAQKQQGLPVGIAVKTDSPDDQQET